MSYQYKLFQCFESLEYYKCPFCNYAAFEKTQINNHNSCEISEVSYEVNLKQCNRCQVTSFSSWWLYFHERKCTFAIDRLIREVTPINLNVAVESHYSNNVHCFQCDQCDYSSTKEKYLKSHKYRKHSSSGEQKWFKCDHDQCEYKTKVQSYLSAHKHRQHLFDPDQWFTCDQCDYKTNRKMNIYAHRSRTHLGKSFECDQCDYKTTCIAYLKTHKKSRKHSLPNIKRERFECDQCDLQTTSKEYLMRHKRIKHAPEELQKWFKCDMCEFKTNTFKWKLDRHMNMKHFKQTWFKCDQYGFNGTKCVYKTLTKYNLSQHKKRMHFLSI